MDEFAVGRDRERKAIVAYLRHAASCHGLTLRMNDPLVATLEMFAERIEGGWHCTTSVAAEPKCVEQEKP